MSAYISVLYISDDEIRLLSCQWPVLSTCKRVARSADLEKDLKGLVSSMDMKEHSCLLVIPRRESVFKVIKMPSVHDDEIQRMLTIQVPTIVPFEETQVVHHHQILRTRESGESDVLAMIVLNSSIQKYMDAVEAAGLDVQDIYLSFNGIANYLQAFINPEVLSDCCGVVVCTDRCSEMVILDGGKAVFSYHLAFGKKDISQDKAGFLEAIQSKVRDYLQNNTGRELTDIYFYFTTEEHHKIKSIFAKTDLQVHGLDFFKSLPDSVKDLIQKEEMDESWILVLGFFAGEGHNVFHSFLPYQIHSSKRRKKEHAILVKFLSMVLCSLLFFAGLLWVIFYRHTLYLKMLSQKISVLEPQVAQMTVENNFLNKASGPEDQDNSVVSIIKEIYGLFPKDVSIQYFSMRDGGNFEIQGFSSEDQGVNELQAALVSSKRLQNVDLKYATKRKRFKTEYTEFKITFQSMDKS